MNRDCDPRISCGLGVTSTELCEADAPSMKTLKVRLIESKIRKRLGCIFCHDS